jgi:nucleoside-diphosphate-sugar epimerase
MRLLVLGAAGVVGSAVVRHAARERLDVHALVRTASPPERLGPVEANTRLHRLDLRDAAALARLLDELSPEAIVHAAFPPFWGHDRPSRERLITEGLGLSLNLAEVLRERRFAGTLVLLSSATVYGPGPHPHDPGDRPAPNTYRGAVKAAEELLLSQCAHDLGFRLFRLRLFTAYGPWEQRERLVPSLMRAALTGTEVSLTARAHARDWIHLDDVARACLVAARASSPAGGIHNLCTGRTVDTHALAREAERITGGRRLVRDHDYPDRDAYGNDHPLGVPPDRAAFDWAPIHGLADGLERTWEWARSAAGRRYLLGHAVDA